MTPPTGSDRRWRNHRVEHERDRERSRRLWALVLGMAIAAAPAGFWLLQQNECLKLAYELNQLKVRQEQLVEREQALAVQRARLQALPGIERWARAERGLVEPRAEQVVTLTAPGTSSRDLVARAAAPGRAALR